MSADTVATIVGIVIGSFVGCGFVAARICVLLDSGEDEK